MPETPHIKRFDEWEKEAYRIAKQAGDVKIETQAEVFASKMMLDELAERLERLERQLAAVPIGEEVPKLIARVRRADTSLTVTDPTQDGNHTL